MWEDFLFLYKTFFFFPTEENKSTDFILFFKKIDISQLFFYF